MVESNGAVKEGQELMPELAAMGGSLTPMMTLDVTGSTKSDNRRRVVYKICFTW